MSYLPLVTGDRVLRALLKAGFVIHHRKGSHVTLKHPSNPISRIIIPVHSGKTLGKGLIGSILKEANLSVEYFRKLL